MLIKYAFTLGAGFGLMKSMMLIETGACDFLPLPLWLLVLADRGGACCNCIGVGLAITGVWLTTFKACCSRSISSCSSIAALFACSRLFLRLPESLHSDESVKYYNRTAMNEFSAACTISEVSHD